MTRVFLFGADIKPGQEITGVPPGAKVRLRIRPDDFSIAYVRTENETATHCLELLDDGTVRLGERLAINHRNVKVSL